MSSFANDRRNYGFKAAFLIHEMHMDMECVLNVMSYSLPYDVEMAATHRNHQVRKVILDNNPWFKDFILGPCTRERWDSYLASAPIPEPRDLLKVMLLSAEIVKRTAGCVHLMCSQGWTTFLPWFHDHGEHNQVIKEDNWRVYKAVCMELPHCLSDVYYDRRDPLTLKFHEARAIHSAVYDKKVSHFAGRACPRPLLRGNRKDDIDFGL